MPSISTHSRSSSTTAHRCAACCTLFSRPELPHNQNTVKSSRPLPVPPPLPAQAAPSSPMAPLLTPVTPKASLLPSPRPLPKMPRSSPIQHRTTERNTYRPLLPASQDDLARPLPVLQQPVNSKEILHGDLSEPQHHPEKSAPSDMVPPELDAGGLSNNLSRDEKHPRPEYLWEVKDTVSPVLEKSEEEGSETLVRRYSRRCLREEKGRRWIEEDYRLVAEFLRKLR